MRVMVLNEARPLETGYHYTNIVGMINILNSGTMLATNRRIGLDDSRLNRKTLNKTIGELLKPLLTDEIKDKIFNFYENPLVRQQQLMKYMKEKDYIKIKSKIKNFDMKLKDAFASKLVDKTLMLSIDPEELEFLGDYNTASRSKAIFKYEMGYSTTSKGNSGERKAGDSVYNNKSWSYTRSKVRINVLNKTPDLVRITLDIDKISRNQTVDAFAWKGNNRTTNNYEYEERVMGNTEDIGRYIKAIDFPEEIEDDKHYIFKDKDGKIYNISEIANDLRVVFEEKSFNNTVIQGLYNGYVEKIKVKDYYLDYIENSLQTNKVNNISGKTMRTSKKINLKSYKDVVDFIRNVESVTSLKEPGKKRSKTVKKKLNIKIGTYKTPNFINKFILTDKILEKVQYALDIKKGKRDFPVANIEKLNKSILPEWITGKLNELPNHHGKIYIIDIEDRNWSNFLLSNNPERDIGKSSKLSKSLKLEKYETIKISNDLNDNHDAIRNRKVSYRYFSYKKLLLLWSSKTKSKNAIFDSLEDFVAFLFDYINKRLKSQFECVIATSRGGLKIKIDTDKKVSSFVYQSSCT